MQVNNVAVPTFRAGISNGVKRIVSDEAILKSSNAYKEYLDKSKSIESWGNETSSLSLVDEWQDEVKKTCLVLVDSYLAPLRQVKLPQKNSPLESFMALTKKDITEAEKHLKY